MGQAADGFHLGEGEGRGHADDHLVRGDAGLGLLPVADGHAKPRRLGTGGSGFPRPQGLEHLFGDEGDQFFIEFHGFALLTESTRSQRPAGCF